MGKERHNINTIAEVLIDKLNNMERTAGRIEKASSKELKIDTAEMKTLIENQISEQKAILSDLRKLREKNKGRMPNWVLAIVLGFILSSFGVFIYSLSKEKAYQEAVEKATYFEQEYNKLKK